ncbi:MAG: M36 family metallopeptidase [Flavobacteriales bacterium]
MTIRFTFPLLAAIAFGLSANAQQRLGKLPEEVSKQLKEGGFADEDIADLVVKDDYHTTRNGMHHLFLRQRWQGIEVWNGDIAIHTSAGGALLKLNNGAWPHMAKRVNVTEPVLSASDALRTVLAKTAPGTPLPVLMSSSDDGRKLSYDGSALGGQPVNVELVYQPVGERLLLAWNVNHYVPGGSHWWNVRINAVTGAELDRNDWVSQCGFDEAFEHSMFNEPEVPFAPAAPNDYRVYPLPLESPSHGSNAIRNAPWTGGGVASPFGWHDTNGAAGAEYTITRGNNVLAQEDANANDGTGASPSGGPTLDFDFTYNLAAAPSTYVNAATTNLFYWNNLMHDVWYQYGFDDPSGNFQQNNYGRGGAGNDYVLADAQDGGGTNNANFGTPPDGGNPRMQMYIWTSTSPQRDGDIDNGIIAHEYTHGISNRLVGGPANTNCLGNAEQMGEGWSDWFGLVMTIEPGDQGTDRRGIGTYVLGQSITGGGIRPAPYSTNFSENSYTYAALNNPSLAAPHGVGFVWCTMLWEMTWELINQYGFDPDVYTGNGGNNIAMQLVVDGLKLTPCNPGFVDARDAILAADLADFGGANQNLIWAAFARRGLGSSASQGSSNNRLDQAEAYDTPLPNNVGVAAVLSPVGALFDCGGTPLTVSATIRNYGQSTQTGFNVRYQLDGGTQVVQTFAGTLAGGASTTFTFTQPVVVSGVGAHSLVVSTALAGDQYAGNDQATSAITLSAATTISAPFTEAIESGATTPAGWTLQNVDGGGTWTTTSMTGQSACVGSRSWSIDFYSVNAVGQEDRLLTPLVSLAAGTHLKFSHAYSGYSSSYVDGFRVDISTNCGGSWTALYQASGAALQTTAYSTNSYTPNACAQWLAHDMDISAYDGQTVMFRFVGINGYGNWLYLDNAQVESNGVKVALKLLLDGAYDPGTDRMRDSLRTAAAFPLTEPYTGLGFAQVGGGGGETIAASVLTTTGDNAVVDWVLLELRNSVTPATRVATRCALVQRDGDVVDKDGLSPVTFLAGPGNYYVAARHRNHLGAMTAAPVALTGSPLTVDFTSTGTTTYGIEARRPVNGRMALWSGNVLRDNVLQYTGQGNDRDPVLGAVGGSVPTNTAGPGYFQEDVNLDRLVRYIGQDNDRDPILQSVGGSVPTATRAQQLP